MLMQNSASRSAYICTRSAYICRNLHFMQKSSSASTNLSICSSAIKGYANSIATSALSTSANFITDFAHTWTVACSLKVKSKYERIILLARRILVVRIRIFKYDVFWLGIFSVL